MIVAGLPIAGVDLSTVAVSLLGSSVAAALVAGLLTRSAERTKQLREQMMEVADAFAAGTMEALARIRDFKPTKPKPYGHRNEPLHTDLELRAEFCEKANRAVDLLRPLRGRVHIAFATSSKSEEEVLKHAAIVIRSARDMVEASEHFWKRCDADPAGRKTHEAEEGAKYAAAQGRAWSALYEFCDVAGSQMRNP